MLNAEWLAGNQHLKHVQQQILLALSAIVGWLGPQLNFSNRLLLPGHAAAAAGHSCTTAARRSSLDEIVAATADL
jgi:hypothetical protein